MMTLTPAQKKHFIACELREIGALAPRVFEKAMDAFIERMIRSDHPEALADRLWEAFDAISSEGSSTVWEVAVEYMPDWLLVISRALDRAFEEDADFYAFVRGESGHYQLPDKRLIREYARDLTACGAYLPEYCADDEEKALEKRGDLRKRFDRYNRAMAAIGESS